MALGYAGRMLAANRRPQIRAKGQGWGVHVQVPSGWRPVIEDPSTLQLFLDFYAVTKPPLSNSALECLVTAPLPVLWDQGHSPVCVFILP